MTKDKVVHELETTKNLVRWEISGLNLSGVDFAGANLDRATLSQCRLTGASFAGANLRGATFERCRLGAVDFAGADLRGVHLVRCSGLTPGIIASLEKKGAIVEQPASRASVFVVAAIVLLGAIALFMFAGGYEFFQKSADVPPTADATVEPSPDGDFLARAKAAFKAEDYAVAADLYGQAEAAGTAETEDMINHVIACRHAGRHGEVPALAEQVVAKTDKEAEKLYARILLAGALLAGGKRDDGLALYDQLLQESVGRASDQRAILMDKGTVLWQAGKSADALAAFKKLLAVSDPDQKAGVWLNIALVHRDAKNTTAETAALRKAEKDAAAPPAVRVDAKLGLAMIDIRIGRIKQAREQIIEVLGANGNAGQVLNAAREIAARLAKEGKAPEIEALYRQLVDAFSGTPSALNDARVDLANFLNENKRVDEALALYELVAGESPDQTQKSWAAETVTEIKRQQAATAGEVANQGN